MDYRRYINYQPFAPALTVQTAVIGAVSGAATWLIALGLEKYVLGIILCNSGNSACGSVPFVAIVLGLLIAHFVGLVALIRAGAMRPLLIIIASIASLWGFHTWLTGLAWWLAVLYAALLFGLAYVFYGWVNRLAFFPAALVLTILGVAAIRLLIASW